MVAEKHLFYTCLTFHYLGTIWLGTESTLSSIRNASMVINECILQYTKRMFSLIDNRFGYYNVELALQVKYIEKYRK